MTVPSFIYHIILYIICSGFLYNICILCGGFFLVDFFWWILCISLVLFVWQYICLWTTTLFYYWQGTKICDTITRICIAFNELRHNFIIFNSWCDTVSLESLRNCVACDTFSIVFSEFASLVIERQVWIYVARDTDAFLIATQLPRRNCVFPDIGGISFNELLINFKTSVIPNVNKVLTFCVRNREKLLFSWI